MRYVRREGSKGQSGGETQIHPALREKSEKIAKGEGGSPSRQPQNSLLLHILR